MFSLLWNTTGDIMSWCCVSRVGTMNSDWDVDQAGCKFRGNGEEQINLIRMLDDLSGETILSMNDYCRINCVWLFSSWRISCSSLKDKKMFQLAREMQKLVDLQWIVFQVLSDFSRNMNNFRMELIVLHFMNLINWKQLLKRRKTNETKLVAKKISNGLMQIWILSY